MADATPEIVIEARRTNPRDFEFIALPRIGEVPAGRYAGVLPPYKPIWPSGPGPFIFSPAPPVIPPPPPPPPPNPVNSVPEPSTWTLILMGFALTGQILRRKPLDVDADSLAVVARPSDTPRDR